MTFKIHRKEEEHLIEGCLRRDRKSQQQLYDVYSAKMYAICYRYVRDHAEAEDILVMAFTRIFEKIYQFKGEGSLEGWIRRVVVNEALSAIRKQRSMYLQTEIEKAEGEPDYHALTDQLQADDLISLIAQLPAGYRVVFNMYAIDGYSHKEIAEQLGITESTSKSQLSRARCLLQKLLHEQELVENKKISSDE